MDFARALAFGPFRLMGPTGPLYRDDAIIELRPKALGVLWYLANHAGEVVSKDTLVAAKWAPTVISDIGPAVCIHEIRRALNDAASTPTYIQTVHRRGYRFLAPVTRLTEAAPSAASVTVVGRDRELEHLEQLFAQACDGQRQIVFLTGEPGIGKTTTVDTLAQSLSHGPNSPWIARGQCINHLSAGEPYLPLLESLHSLCRGTQRDQVLETLRQVAPSWLWQLPALVEDAEREALERQLASANTERMQREIVDALEALSVIAPLVLVLEDLHWCDPSTVDAIAMLARHREWARLLLIGTCRPMDLAESNPSLKQLKQELQIHGQCEELALDYLNVADVAAYLAQVCPDSDAQALAPPMYQRTAGHPLFLATLVEHLRNEAGRDGPAAASAALDASLPTSLREFIELRLCALSAFEQLVLEAASVRRRRVRWGNAQRCARCR